MKNIITAILMLMLSVVAAFGQDATEMGGAPPPLNDGRVAAVAPKAEGFLRIGVVSTKIQVGPEASGGEAAGMIRSLLMENLKGPTVEVVMIDAKSPTNVGIEATQKQCDYVLFTSLSKKTKTSIFGSLVKAAAPVVISQVPGVGAFSQTAVSATKQAVTSAGKEMVNGAIASQFGAKDEIVINFILTGPDGKALVNSSTSAKVKADGEDVLTSLIETASEKVLQAVVKK